MLNRIISLFCVMAMMIAFVPSTVSASAPLGMNDTEWELLKLTNDERTKVGLKPLSAFAKLQWCADTRADELTRLFSHTRPNGQSCMSIFDGMTNLNHYGENVAAGYITPAEVLDVWMHSQNGHKENILYSGFSHMSCGYLSVNDNKYIRYWVQSFVGDCTVTSIRCSSTPIFNTKGELVNDDIALILTCAHGESYLPLANVEYYCNSTAYGPATMKVVYDGKTYTMGCAVGYKDISKNAWYYESVVQATKLGLFSGTSEETFSPNGSMTRAMLVSVLYRMENSPDIGYTDTFIDVPRGQWYSKAVAWAEANGIVSGMTAFQFAPNREITREQITCILYRYAQYKGINTDARASVDFFNDSNRIHSYALDAIEWAYAEKLLQGKTDLLLDPLGDATRAQVCAIVIRYLDM